MGRDTHDDSVPAPQKKWCVRRPRKIPIRAAGCLAFFIRSWLGLGCCGETPQWLNGSVDRQCSTLSMDGGVSELESVSVHVHETHLRIRALRRSGCQCNLHLRPQTAPLPRSAGTLSLPVNPVIITAMPPAAPVLLSSGSGHRAGASRKRSMQACLSCRTRKVRCDVLSRGYPCTNCDLDSKNCLVVERASRLYEDPENSLQHPFSPADFAHVPAQKPTSPEETAWTAG